MESALYLGKLRHRRFSPREHHFTYPVFMAFLDIDRLPELLGVSPFSSYNRWNWIAYNERDHFGDPKKRLRQRLREDVARHGIELPSGKIFVLTHLRYLGYVFNPVSFFYCYNEAGELAMILSEVNNTFGESHNYWLTPETQQPNAAALRYITPKQMYVSPFHPMDLEYVWIFTPPGEQLVAHMNTLAEGHPNFDATLQLERRPWNARELLRILARYPLMSLRVTAAIHWEALELWVKGVPVYRHPGKVARQAAAVASKGQFPG
jgi:DUF1365 family protein